MRAYVLFLRNWPQMNKSRFKKKKTAMQLFKRYGMRRGNDWIWQDLIRGVKSWGGGEEKNDGTEKWDWVVREERYIRSVMFEWNKCYKYLPSISICCYKSVFTFLSTHLIPRFLSSISLLPPLSLLAILFLPLSQSLSATLSHSLSLFSFISLPSALQCPPPQTQSLSEKNVRSFPRRAWIPSHRLILTDLPWQARDEIWDRDTYPANC